MIQWKTWSNRQLCFALLLGNFMCSSIMLTLYQKQEEIMRLRLSTKETLWYAAISRFLPTCADVQKDLGGAIELNLKPKPMPEIERHLPWIERGGHYSPHHCIARQKVAIVIPYRNRFEHLRVLLFHLHPILSKQEIDYTIYVVEQAQPVKFNRGMLMNIGFIEASRKDKYDCFVFHDVDLIPENGNTMYRCSQKPLHMCYTSKFNYTLPGGDYSFGGINLFKTEDYRATNGFSNCYFGWGGEDDDLYSRVHAIGLGFERVSAKNGRYTMIKHGPDVGNKMEERRHELLRSAKTRYKNEGLNTAVYHLLGIEQYPLYTRIHVNITRSEIEKKCNEVINSPKKSRKKKKLMNEKANN